MGRGPNEVPAIKFLDAWAQSQCIEEMAKMLRVTPQNIRARRDYFRKKGIRLRPMPLRNDWACLKEYAEKIGATE